MSNGKGEKWPLLDITVRHDAAESIEFALNSLQALGTAISFRRTGQTEALTVTGYFDELPTQAALEKELGYALRTYGFNMDVVISVKESEIENADWLAEWKKHWKPTTIGRFVIAPPWASVDEPEKVIVRIEPNMAFGTGTHETTQLCLDAIDRLYLQCGSFLDIGTGTGILAIAAAKVGSGSQEILAIDIDPDSIKIGRENAALNGAATIEFRLGALNDEIPAYEFVCANLTIDVILPILSQLLAKTKKILVLSGILIDQEERITDALNEMSIRSYRVERLGEWISVIISVDGK